MVKRIDELDVVGKRVIVRGDLDVGEDFESGDDQKLETILETLNYLLQNQAKVFLIGHRGRPQGKVDEKLSLLPVKARLEEMLDTKIEFATDLKELDSKDNNYGSDRFLMLENLRFWNEEKENDEGFAQHLASFVDIYVNEAFSSSHRKHASILALPEFVKNSAEDTVALGFHFKKEIENLDRILQDPERPVVTVLGGVKEDKLNYAEKFKRFADKILIGGRLPIYLDEDLDDEKYMVAKLNPDKEDITVKSIEMFEHEIAKAKTIVVNGPMGKFEEEGQRLGTKRVFEAIAKNKNAFRLAGGGDTGQAVMKFGLMDDFDWVSVGGGASLDYLADGGLPGIEVLFG